MWLLVTSTGKLIYLKSNISVSIGRKKSDILLSHDASVSKLHASIVVKPHSNFMTGKPTSSCILKDEGSKYGTYICKNGTFEKITTEIYLKDQDLMRIGLQKEIFTVKYISIISMTSALQDNEKKKLLEIMNVIDGIITTDWNKYCTHLTVVKPKLTQKVAVSLAACIPIVSIDYWDAVKTVIEMGDPLPETDKFIPKINEQYISNISTSLSPNYERKTLFTNLTFIFFTTKQYELYNTMIQLAGGKSILFNPNNKMSNTFEHYFIFVQYSVTDNTQLAEDFLQGYDYIRKKLNTRKQRVIPESEIPLAILHYSTRQYCNPNFNFGICLKKREKSNYNLPETLVVDTQDQGILTVDLTDDFAEKQKSCNNKHTNYVAETLENDNDTSIQDKAIPQKNLHNLKELTPEREHTILKKLFVPETIESSWSSQRNIDSCIKQKSNYDLFEANINKEMHTPISTTFGKKHIATFLDECDKGQVVTSHMNEGSPSKLQICIPETIDDNYSDCPKKCNKVPMIVDSPVAIDNVFKENDSNDIIKNEIRKDAEYMFITTRNISKAEETKNIQPHKNNEGRKMIPGKTFKKAYIKIPEKRKRLMNITEKN